MLGVILANVAAIGGDGGGDGQTEAARGARKWIVLTRCAYATCDVRAIKQLQFRYSNDNSKSNKTLSLLLLLCLL